MLPGRFVALVIVFGLQLHFSELLPIIPDEADVIHISGSNNVTITFNMTDSGHIRFDALVPTCNSSEILVYIGTASDCLVNVTWYIADGESLPTMRVRFSSKGNITGEITQFGREPGSWTPFGISTTYFNASDRQITNVCGEKTDGAVAIVGNSSCGTALKFVGFLLEFFSTDPSGHDLVLPSDDPAKKNSYPHWMVIDWTGMLWLAVIIVVSVVFHILIFLLIYNIMRYNMELILPQTVDEDGSGVAPLEDVHVSSSKNSK